MAPRRRLRALLRTAPRPPSHPVRATSAVTHVRVGVGSVFVGTPAPHQARADPPSPPAAPARTTARTAHRRRVRARVTHLDGLELHRLRALVLEELGAAMLGGGDRQHLEAVVVVLPRGSRRGWHARARAGPVVRSSAGAAEGRARTRSDSGKRTPPILTRAPARRHADRAPAETAAVSPQCRVQAKCNSAVRVRAAVRDRRLSCLPPMVDARTLDHGSCAGSRVAPVSLL